MKTILLAFIVSFLFIVASPAQAEDYDRTLNFSMLRNGDKIGEHIIKIHKKGSMTKVDITTQSEVKVFGIRAYYFKFKGNEVWKDGKLIEMETETNDNGDNSYVKVEKKRDKLEVRTHAGRYQVSADTIPSSWWNSATVSQTELLDIITGQMKKVAVTQTGSEEVLVDKRSIKSDRYKIDGELAREVWYSKNGKLLRQSLEKKGSKITYVLK